MQVSLEIGIVRGEHELCSVLGFCASDCLRFSYCSVRYGHNAWVELTTIIDSREIGKFPDTTPTGGQLLVISRVNNDAVFGLKDISCHES